MGLTVQYLVTTVVAILLALYTAWDLTLVTVATVPLGTMLLSWISKKIQPAIKSQAEKLSEAAKLVSNAFGAIETVHCSNAQDFELRQYSEWLIKAAKSYRLQARANSLQVGVVRFLILSLFVQGFWYGNYLVSDGTKSPAQILTALWACLMSTKTFEQVMPKLVVLEKGRAAASSLRAHVSGIEITGHFHSAAEAKKPNHVDGDIQVRGVSPFVFCTHALAYMF